MTTGEAAASSDGVGASAPCFVSDGPIGDDASALGTVDHGRFERRQLIGIGGMGQVTVVYDRALRREVALKEPAPGHDAALLEEARRAASLEHPGIVPILDSGVDESGRPWYTMRLLRGRSLQDALGSEAEMVKRLSYVRALLSAAQAVAYAHSRGVVHRDLTPANILLGEPGEVFVIDWGLAAAQGARGGGGTRGYRAPEQASGAPADARADVYGLGAILFTICAGASLAAGVSLPKHTPPELAAVIHRATALSPADRYADARDFAADISAWLDGRLVSVHPYSLWERVLRFAAANRAALAVVCSAAMVLAVSSGLQYGAMVRERDRALAAEVVATTRLGVAIAGQAAEAFQEGRLGDAAVLAAQASSLIGEGSPVARARAVGVLAGVHAGRLPESRELVVAPTGCEDIRLGIGGYVCIGADSASAWSWSKSALSQWEGRWADAVWSDHGVVGLGYDGTVHSMRGTYRLPPGVRPFRLAIGGGTLAAASGGVLWSLSLKDGSTRTGPVPCAPGERLLGTAVDAGGRLAVACSSQDVFVGAADALVRARARLPHPAAVAWVEGDLLVGTISGEVVRMSLDGAEVWRASLGHAAVVDIGLAGADLVWVRTPRSTSLLDARSGVLRTALPPSRVAPVVDENGWLRAVSVTGEIRAWRLPMRWAAVRVTTPSGLSAVAVSPDGSEVALGGRATSVTIWRIADGAVRRESLAEGVVKSFSWGADGLRATVSGSNTTMLVTPDGPVVDQRRPSVYRRIGSLPGGQLISLPYGDSPHVWDDATGGVRVLNEIPECVDLGAGPESAALLDIEGGVWVLNGADGRWLRVVTVPSAQAVDVGALGRVVVAASDRMVMVNGDGTSGWEVSLDGRSVLDVAWSPDGALIATGSIDGTADVWHAEDGGLLATLAGHADRLSALEFSPDGAWLVTASWDQSARLWFMEPVLSPPSPAEVETMWGASFVDGEGQGRGDHTGRGSAPQPAR
ncbi:MAG: hypothetical protein RL071_2484 [Pseudomonadota bacterium]